MEYIYFLQLLTDDDRSVEQTEYDLNKWYTVRFRATDMLSEQIALLKAYTILDHLTIDVPRDYELVLPDMSGLYVRSLTISGCVGSCLKIPPANWPKTPNEKLRTLSLTSLDRVTVNDQIPEIAELELTDIKVHDISRLPDSMWSLETFNALSRLPNLPRKLTRLITDDKFIPYPYSGYHKRYEKSDARHS